MIIIGAGGHAKTIVDALWQNGIHEGSYIDPDRQQWIEDAGYRRIEESEIPPRSKMVIGFVGLTVAALERRYRLMRDYMAQSHYFPPVIHPSATVSRLAQLTEGCHIMAGACVNAHATIGQGAVINTNAIVEHDSEIGYGSHIAPGAAVLGNANVGVFSFIGCNAVVIQSTAVPPRTFLKALRHNA